VKVEVLRQDLVRSVKANGCHGFKLPVPEHPIEMQEHCVLAAAASIGQACRVDGWVEVEVTGVAGPAG
jgi:hypothetical protein